ncbi:hypothetical protein AAG906_021520 [Vitis piasezkii]
MLKKDSFEWSGQAEEAFQKLKLAMTHTSERPIAFFSCAIQRKHLYLSTYEKEILALVLAVQKWRPKGHENMVADALSRRQETQHSPAPSGENHSIFKGQLSTLDLAIIPKQMVFHVSLLKKHIGEGKAIQATLPDANMEENGKFPITQAILDRRVRKKREKVLIHGQGLSPMEAKWEERKLLKNRFPDLTLEDKGAL